MPRSSSHIRYLGLFALAAMLGGVGYRTIDWAATVRGCPFLGEADTYLAYCNSEQYGDYEHGAYYFGLEPQALANLRTAMVLVLGGSRAQFGFSTPQVRDFFQSHATPYHLMGFGYSDGVLFTEPLLRSHALKPKAVIVVTDPFFSNHLSDPGRAILGQSSTSWTPVWATRLWAWSSYAAKKMFNTLQQPVCNYGISLCRPQARSISRSATDGAWLTTQYSPPDTPEYPVTAKKVVPLNPSPPDADIERARVFLATLGLPKTCVFLTVAPNTAIDAEPYAAELGRRLDLMVVLPQMEGLSTIDGSHLGPTSAQRWSTEILRLLERPILECTAR